MENFLIRNATLDDAPRLVEIYSYYVEKTAITFECEVPGVEKFQTRMQRTQKHYPYLVAEIDGKIVVTPMQNALSVVRLTNFRLNLRFTLIKIFVVKELEKNCTANLKKICAN